MTRASIVIPVHNGWTLTRTCLDALAGQDLGTDTEIIVVDDASTDETRHRLADRLRQAEARGPRLTVVTHLINTGFAGACNDGAARAGGTYLVFLNNDTVPEPGWLEALVNHADEHPAAAAVGAKLLYPDGTVQHAGVVIGQDRNPHHVYQGFPGTHPAVNRSRRFQVVTAACMLVRADAFRQAGGFNTGFRNGHEDVDLCLRLGEAGYDIRYCHEAVVTHLESVSRGRGTPEAASNGRRYRDRWARSVRPDDLAVYVEDGLMSVGYGDAYPLRFRVSPLLATLHDGPRQRATERLLRSRAQQVADLLQHQVSLTLASDSVERVIPASDPELDDELAEALAHLRRALAARRGEAAPAAPTETLRYRRLVGRVRAALAALTPPDATVAVVSRGDDDLLDLEGRTGWHFPQDEDGIWHGYHPADSDDAVAALRAVAGKGATHLAVPGPSLWWLDQYRGFAEHLRSAHTEVAATEDVIVYALRGAVQVEPR